MANRSPDLTGLKELQQHFSDFTVPRENPRTGPGFSYVSGSAAIINAKRLNRLISALAWPMLYPRRKHLPRQPPNPLRQPQPAVLRPERHRPTPAGDGSSRRPQNFSRGLRNLSGRSGSRELLGRSRLHLYALACRPGGGAGCRSRRSGGRLEFRDSLGLLRLLRSPDHSSRPVEPGCRAKTAGTHHGAVREVGRAGRGPFHVCRQRQTRQPLPEIRILAALSHRPDVEGRERAGDANHPLLLFNARRSGANFLDACRGLSGHLRRGWTCRWKSVRYIPSGSAIRSCCGAANRLDGFAVCHGGEGLEAGRGNCYVKFAAARPGPGVEQRFGLLLQGCEALAADRGWERLEAGDQPGPQPGLSLHAATWFRAVAQGVAMHAFHDSPGYNVPDVFVVDDWR